MAEEVVDKNWRRELKSKGGVMVMIIMGCIFDAAFFAGEVLCIIDGADIGSFVCGLGSLGCTALFVLGIIGAARVKAHNRRIEKLHNEKVAAHKAKEQQQAVAQQGSAADELKKFKELLDSGVITQEEFDEKKKQLLGL